jgi:decaprenylphospho-beta-D-ribofuranose 2-oxidase
MPPVDSVRESIPAPAVISGWGGGPGAPVSLLQAINTDALASALAGRPTSGAIARGMGRSYGDAAQLTGGLVLEATQLKRFALDAEDGTVTAEAGVTLGELLRALVTAGWMVPVLPGTQHVTVGGAIASDIHGKNHGSDGTFGTHVTAIQLLSAAGELLELEPGDDLFAATLGGMGLTGVIVSARIRLRPIRSPLLSVDTDRCGTLDAVLAALACPGGSYRVAWLDLLCSRPGRGIVTRADHLDEPAAGQRAPSRRGPTVAARATVPRHWPRGVLRPGTVQLFNDLRFRRFPRRERGQLEGIGKHMFPLDVLDAWPRLYGPRGFVQYQLVVPPGQERVLELVIETLGRTRVPCYLAVLKDFGPANGAPLSFPIEGWTLTLDLPRAAPGLAATLQRWDELVVTAGGRVYLSKDDRLTPATVAAMYPRLGEWQAVRDGADPDGVWRSDLGLRTGLVAAR